MDLWENRSEIETRKARNENRIMSPETTPPPPVINRTLINKLNKIEEISTKMVAGVFVFMPFKIWLN
ncbi:hypothetical protein ACFL1N_10710 [Thermodesulfobacteriota bacterium]